MPDLRRVLKDYDLSLLRTIAGLWGIELEAPNQAEAVEALAPQLLDPDLLAEGVAALPSEARAALQAVARERLPLAPFTRKYGEARAMGPARREREQPWLNAPSTAEVLWYRGLIGRAFFAEGGLGPQEFVFVPDDLRPLLPFQLDAVLPAAPPGHPAEPPAEGSASLAGAAPDDAATLLAYLQVEGAVTLELEAAQLALFPARHRAALSPYLLFPAALDFYLSLLMELGLVMGAPLKLDAAKVRPFLETSRSKQIERLAETWRTSKHWNDLRHVPGLIFEGTAWHNDPLTARQAILNLLAEVPPGEWWSLESFIGSVKERQPDFQRPAGDYDSWYIRDELTRDYLRGFQNWDHVDGAYVRWLIWHPLYRLGLIETSRPPGAFRFTPYGAAFLGLGAWPEESEPAPIRVSATGVIHVPSSASRYTRFQVARIGDWLAPERDDYLYRLTPTSLERAAKRGITVRRIEAFLREAVGDEALPPGLLGALHRWERSGSEGALKEMTVLRLKNDELLETLRRTPGLAHYLGERLGPGAVEVRRADLNEVRTALLKVGILVDG
jgi:hypothetical protein